MPAAIFEAVLGNLAVASALAVLALAAGRWANRPALAHALWLLVLVKLLTPPVVTIPVRCLPAREEAVVPPPAASPVLPPTSPEPLPVAVLEPPASAAGALAQPVAPADSAAAVAPPALTPVPAPQAAERPSRWVPSWESALLGVWLLGAGVSFGVAVRRVRRFGRLLKYASAAPADLVDEVTATAEQMRLRRVPRVRVVPGGIAPLLWAVGRPTLYFPAGLLGRLSLAQRQSLVAHELAHLRRWDHLVRLAEFVAVAAYWWCPLAWLARRELRRLEEEACDADVLAAVPGSGYAYASAILETIDYLAGVAPAPALASGIGDAASLRRRLLLILGPTRPARTSFRVRCVLGAAALGLLAVGLRFDRLAAATAEAAFGEPEEVTERTLEVHAAANEVFAEPVQFLPTPERQLYAADLGPAPSHAAALAPDGSRLAVAVGPTVVVFDAATRRKLFTLAHADTVNAVVFSPDGTRVATASNDATAAVWDAATGARLHSLTGHGRWVLGAAFSPDGRTLVTGGYDKTVRLWDAATGESKATWTGHTGGVRAVAFSPDGETVATGGADGEVRVWEAGGGRPVLTLRRHESAVRVVAYSPDGSRLASGSEDRTVRVCDSHSGREVGKPLQLPDYVTALGFSRHGQVLVAGTFGGHLLNVNPLTGRARGYVGVEPGRPAASPAHAGAVAAVLAPPDGKSLLTVSQDRVVLAWPAAGPPQSPRLTFRGQHPLTAVALSPDGRLLAAGGHDGVIRVWDAGTARELAALPGHPGGVRAVVFGAGGQLVSAGADERVRVWDVPSGRATATPLQPSADLELAPSPDGRTLAIGGRRLPGVTLLNLAGGGKPRRIGEWAGEVTAVAFDPAGKRIATGYADGMVRFWDADRGQEVARGVAGDGSADGVSFDPTGKVAAVVLNGSPDAGPAHEVVFLDARDGSVKADLRPLSHPGPVTAAAFTAAGEVLTAAHDGNLYVWDAAGKVVRTIRGHVDAVRGVALAADGTAVFSAGDRSAKKWPMKSDKK